MGLHEVLTDLGDAVREKAGRSDKLTLEEMAVEIWGLDTGGAALPELENPGDGDKLLAGYQLIGQDGQIVDGEIAARSGNDVSAAGRTVTVCTRV